jgi:hypothetical protein
LLRCVHYNVELSAASHDRVEQAQRGAARREARRIGLAARSPPGGTAISHDGPWHGWRDASMIL